MTYDDHENDDEALIEIKFWAFLLLVSPFFPQIEFLHCIRQSAEGGDNQFTDGFNCAAQLKQSHPDLYKILTTTSVDFRNWKVDLNDEANGLHDIHIKHKRPIVE